MTGVAGRLEGKVALVTGAARGTGAEIARCFVAEGAEVLLADVLDDRVGAVADELGAPAVARHLDVTDEAAWSDVVAGLDRLDVLVNNAAVLHLATIDATTATAFERVLRVNALGPFLGTRACLPLLRASGRGSIVNIGSIDSVAAAPLTSAYTASKFALRGLTKVTALENRRFGVRANLVCPEAGNPEMHPPVVGWEHLGPPERAAPPGRGPDAVAPAAVYFASDESSLCNGTELVLDAGRSAGQYFELPDELYTARETPG
ncbi:MAG: 3-alpha-(or 20-beta)-hydroxysteroid dehydrogenase [Acidimicrobiales bacterium]|nr:3-alpha-(or 20-beta)-hydroxysteroid dehydrogenase [Acidimicrobiales bacterium]